MKIVEDKSKKFSDKTNNVTLTHIKFYQDENLVPNFDQASNHESTNSKNMVPFFKLVIN